MPLKLGICFKSILRLLNIFIQQLLNEEHKCKLPDSSVKTIYVGSYLQPGDLCKDTIFVDHFRVLF